MSISTTAWSAEDGDFEVTLDAPCTLTLNQGDNFSVCKERGNFWPFDLHIEAHEQAGWVISAQQLFDDPVPLARVCPITGRLIPIVDGRII